MIFESLCNEEFYAPFKIKNDSEYYKQLRDKYKALNNAIQKETSNARIIKEVQNCTKKVCEAVLNYYKGKIYTFHQQIENIIKAISSVDNHENELYYSSAFPGPKGDELQLFRARISSDYIIYQPKEMLHIPFSIRCKAESYRFSIPGLPSLYLSNSTYGCWIETRRPTEHDFNVSPVLLDGKQRIFNLAVMTRDNLDDDSLESTIKWLKQIVLMIATSFVVEDNQRRFKSEYIVSQSIMLACQKSGFDGVAYYSKRVENESLSLASVNLALFSNYRSGEEYGDICDHIIIGESANYQAFKQLNHPNTYKGYQKLRLLRTDQSVFIGTTKRKYEYKYTDFCKFDEFLFGTWGEKENNHYGSIVNRKRKKQTIKR